MQNHRKEIFAIFLITFASSLFFTEIGYQTSAYSAKYFTTRAIIDDGTFKLDKYKAHLGYDQSFHDGSYYAPKAWGTSFLLVPSYLLIGKPIEAILRANNKCITHGFKLKSENCHEPIDYYTFTGWLLQVSTLPVFVGLAFSFLYLLYGQIGIKNNRLLLCLLSFFGSLIFTYSTLGTSDSLNAAFVIAAFYFFFSYLESEGKKQLIISASLFAWLFLIRETSALFSVGPGVVLLQRLLKEKRAKDLIIFSLPMLSAIALTLTLNHLVFGNPLSFPVTKYAPNGTPRETLVYSLALPSLETLYYQFLSVKTGLFFYMPFLIFSIPGLLSLIKNKPQKGKAIALSLLAYLAYYLCYPLWYAGADFGWRYIVPTLPLFIIPSCYWIANNFKTTGKKLLITLACCWSTFVCMLSGITSPWVEPQNLEDPIFSYNIPLLLQGGTSNIFTSYSWNFHNFGQLSPLWFNFGSSAIFLFAIFTYAFFVRGLHGAGLLFSCFSVRCLENVSKKKVARHQNTIQTNENKRCLSHLQSRGDSKKTS